MIQPIYLYGSEVLRKVAEPLDLDKKEEIASLIADLSDTLAKSDGVGLAAPQIGVSRRALIVDAGEVDGDMQYLKGFRRVMINPVVVSESPSMCEYNEGCLSVPGVYADVRRPESIIVEYYDENLEKKTETFDRFGCRMVQHELSHLDGVLFVDMVAPIRRKIISKKLLNISKGKVATHYNSKIK